MKPDALSRALASALPADLSHSPLLGILVVNMGAGIATLAARFLSLGLADLRGHLGIGVDEGAWIGTAFNAATMFIGPLTVYLGALLGTRPVLLVCSGVFAIVSACLPFAHSYSMLILLMAIAGLSSGTFYPLTLSFALREHSAQVPGADARPLCDLYRGRLELCAIVVRLLSESPVVGVDVLDVRSRNAAHGGVRLLRHSSVFAAETLGTDTELRRISVRQRRTRAPVRRARPGTAARLVALQRVHRAVHDRELLPPVRRDPPSAPAESIGGSAVSPQMEHARPGIRGVCVPFLPARDGPRHSADAGRARIRRGSNWSRRGVDGDSGVVARVLRGPPIEQRSRLPSADGKRICGHGKSRAS